VFYWSPYEIKIELGRWYRNASCLEFGITEKQAKEAAFEYIQSEVQTNQALKDRGIVPSMSEYTTLRIIEDSPAYLVEGGVGSEHHPEMDSPNCVWVFVNVFTGKVLGWDFCFLNV
jgi:hypothetical protein